MFKLLGDDKFNNFNHIILTITNLQGRWIGDYHSMKQTNTWTLLYNYYQ